MSADFGSAAWARAEMIEILLEIKEQGMANFTELKRNLETTGAAEMVMATASERLSVTSERVSRSLNEMARVLREVRDRSAGLIPAAALAASAQETTARATEEVVDQLAEQKEMMRAVVRGFVETTVAGGAFAGMLVFASGVMRGFRHETEETNEKVGWLTKSYLFFNAVVAATGGGIMRVLSAPRGWFQIILTGLVILFGPLMMFGATLLASTVIMLSWLAGAAAMIVLLGGLAAGFAALGAVIIAMGFARMGDFAAPTAQKVSGAGGAAAGSQQRLFDAQQSLKDLQARIAAQGHPATLSQQQQLEDLSLRIARAQDTHNAALSRYYGLLAAAQTPLQRFTADFKRLWESLESSAVPLAAMALNFAHAFFPIIGAEGERIISWFGVRMPGALAEMKRVFNDLLPGAERFAGFMGGLFDQFSPIFGAQFEDAIRAISPYVYNLINSLVRLTNWFIKELPVFAPIVNAIFGFIGNIFDSFAGGWKGFADWAARTFWPLLKEIAVEWNKPGVGSSVMHALSDNLPKIGRALDLFVTSSPKWMPALTDVADVILWIAGVAADAAVQVGKWLAELTLWADNNDFWAGLQAGVLSTVQSVLGLWNQLVAFYDWLSHSNPADKPKHPGGSSSGDPYGHAPSAHAPTGTSGSAQQASGGAASPHSRMAATAPSAAYSLLWSAVDAMNQAASATVTGYIPVSQNGSSPGPTSRSATAGPASSASPSSSEPVRVTQNIYGANDPQQTARTTARLLRQVLQT